jgi:nucleotide-binding universal stress UspA family protein
MIKILIPVDFSECSIKAVNFAAQLSHYIPTQLDLLNVQEGTGSLYTDYVGLNREFNLSLMADARKKLEKLQVRLGLADHVVAMTHLVTGEVQETIIAEAAKLKSDLIIMGTSGASGIKELLIGSQTASVIGHSKVPVLAIPEEYKWKKPEKILLATNNFEKDPNVLDTVFQLAGQLQAKVETVVFSEEDSDDAATLLKTSYGINAYEEFLKQEYNQPELLATHITGKKFEETLANHIVQNDVDILIMITYQRSLLKRIFTPSHTRRMSYHTKIPLLAIPCRKED